jgi:hypothetical protein
MSMFDFMMYEYSEGLLCLSTSNSLTAMLCHKVTYRTMLYYNNYPCDRYGEQQRQHSRA